MSHEDGIYLYEMLTLSIEPYAIHSSRSQITFHIQRSEVIINNECVDDNEDDDRFCHHNTTLKMKFMKYSYDHNYYISTSSQTVLQVDKLKNKIIFLSIIEYLFRI